jgi:hypothetical protein
VIASVCALLAVLLGVLALGRDFFDITADGDSPPLVEAMSPDDVVIRRLQSADGKPGTGNTVEVEIVVNQEPEEGHTYWLYSQVPVPNPPHDLFFAVRKIDASRGVHHYVQDLSRATKGVTRTWFIVEVSPEGLPGVQENHENLSDPSWDINRMEFPKEAKKASNNFSVTRTRS